LQLKKEEKTRVVAVQLSCWTTCHSATTTNCLRPTHLQWSALTFFAFAAVAAVSVVAGYLGLLFGAGGAVAYSTVFLAGQQAARLEAQQRRQLGYDPRAHYD
jgi:hypothetical protein